MSRNRTRILPFFGQEAIFFLGEALEVVQFEPQALVAAAHPKEINTQHLNNESQSEKRSSH